MAGLTAPPGFGGNRWGAVDWSRYQSMAAAPFTVASSADWTPSINTGATRTITVGTGSGQAYGVYDTTDAAESVVFAANTGGVDRYDMLVARFDWTTKTRTFAVVTGSTVAPAINTGTSVNASQINRIPGVRYEGLIALIKVRPGVTTFQPGDLYSDMRVWGGTSGPLVTNAIISQRNNLHVPIGSQLMIGGLEVMMRPPSGTLTTLRPRILVVGSGIQSVPFNTDTEVALTNTVFSQGLSYDTATRRVTITEAGHYWCSGNVGWVASPNYRGKRNVALARNGTPLLYAIQSVFMNDADAAYASVSCLLSFSAGDTFSISVAHEAEVPSTGENVATSLDRARCSLSMHYVGG